MLMPSNLPVLLRAVWRDVRYGGAYKTGIL
jgi:hypothetical protein